ncbi:MAG TPA: hypothetical protein ENO23_04060 [Alphaproteobacteria bacterium]|nr:hypothetical protein [Alphaproteobacteria bacterium]
MTRTPAGEDTTETPRSSTPPSNGAPDSLGARLFDNTTLSFLDVIIRKGGTTLVFVLLVRLLEPSDIAAIGIGSGYLLAIGFLDVAPIRALLRDYPHVARDQRRRDQLLSGLLGFWLAQAAVMFIACGLLDALVLAKFELDGLSLLFWAMTADYVVLTLQDWIRIVFYADFRQGTATRISFLINFARLLVYLLLLVDPSLELYSWLLIGTSVCMALWWSVAFQRHYHLRLRIARSAAEELWTSLRSYGLWDHFNRMATDVLFLVDTVVLSAFGLLALLDSYTIAIKFASMLFLIPIQLHFALQLALANVGGELGRQRAINGFLKLTAVISVMQLLFVIVLGDWALRLLFGTDLKPEVFTFTLIITGGVTIMNIAWPLVSVINNLCDLRLAFFRAFLPATVLGLLQYVLFADRYGTLGVAWANVTGYLTLAVALAWFVGRQYPFRLDRRLVTRRELVILRRLWRQRFQRAGA